MRLCGRYLRYYVKEIQTAELMTAICMQDERGKYISYAADWARAVERAAYFDGRRIYKSNRFILLCGNAYAAGSCKVGVIIIYYVRAHSVFCIQITHLSTPSSPQKKRKNTLRGNHTKFIRN